ncbi:MAG: PAS domain-containing protein [Myxococcales bacterium]|nr:PAS domain-containing protein [Myxococcales bacterium]
MHQLLKRQLDRHTAGSNAVPESWRAFVDAIDAAYAQFDNDRAMLERSLELSSSELLQANSELGAVFQAFPDLFLRLDRRGTILDHKGDDRQALGNPPGRLRGRRIDDLPLPGVAEQLAAALVEVLEHDHLVRIEYATEAEHYYEARLLPVLDDQVLVIIREITNRKLAELALADKARDLERSNSELQQFAYIASHDLQEPLRTVQSYLQLLRRRYRGKLDQDADEFIEFAVEGARRMRQLITDLLSFARVSSRARPFEPTELEEVVESVLRSLEVAIEERHAQITHDPLPVVNADRNQLLQLYQNLIANALKFNKDPVPQIHLSAERMGPRWRLTVRDNGIGMRPEYGEKVFEIFKRLEAKDEYEGTGIGLAICKKIVARHGGEIGVESSLGEGSTFWFTLAPAPQRRGDDHASSDQDR